MKKSFAQWASLFPDIEMLIQISAVFHISLDQRILGGNNRNNMIEKLIRDGSETRKARMNMVSTLTGAALMLVGVVCLMIKSMIFEYVDQNGILHENFFLIPTGLLFVFTGFIVIMATAIHFTNRKRKQKKAGKQEI